MDGFPDPDCDPAGWHLALSLKDGARLATPVVVASRAMILLPRNGEGWWAVDDACTACGERLSVSATQDCLEHVVCAACGRAHGPDGDASGPPVMVVDDEVYVYGE